MFTENPKRERGGGGSEREREKEKGVSMKQLIEKYEKFLNTYPILPLTRI
jgi:hypothetical protein